MPIVCYLFKQGIVSSDSCENMIFEQGYTMNLYLEGFSKIDLKDISDYVRRLKTA